ncbi:Branched-chain amino acid transport system / permease component [Acididesulfobacillus acetoxydans]|uniref:Xylose transport system permease protein XylH n=2 Tax=Acididesulfobacillus acetoxydans TaxID=1561005 RepID=A0A8S0VVR7_9FIRM|nr:sugar ABC transporter permease [Acididesulfobacillus acetoxydans]CAA7600013.1 Branched-chain amino acid transport system / permease component [Acididesulfobacillus acetoxydans]CEJ05999.1 Xylose transport system permease protein XylH [Acididesulfobacillus acetoxydans]
MDELSKLFRKNIRDYGMFIALAVIFILFTALTGGTFISPNNISNLINQTGYIAVLAAGMTLVIIIRHIDLSVGFLSGFLGAIAAILITNYNIPAIPAIIIVLAFGALIGLIFGFLVAKVGIPSFVVTLAGMISFHGLLLFATQSGGTINITDHFFNQIGNGFIPSFGRIAGLTVSTLVIGLVGILLFIYFQIKERNTKKRYNFEVSPAAFFLAKLVFISAMITALILVLAVNSGISWTLVIVALVIFVFSTLLNKTALGRHIYGIGGNPEAAELSGISVVKVTIYVFVIMEVLTALAGILFASRMQSASPTGGTGFELLAIAGAFIGGCSASGGVGKVTGSLIGALVMASLTNGMDLMGLGSSVQYMIQGLILVLAVVFDIMTRKSRLNS